MKQEAAAQLFQIAEDQAGYFSLAQARELGLRWNQFPHTRKRFDQQEKVGQWVPSTDDLGEGPIEGED